MKKTLAILTMAAMAGSVAFSAEGDTVTFDTGYTKDGKTASAFADRDQTSVSSNLDYNNSGNSNGGAHGGALILPGDAAGDDYIGVTLDISDLFQQGRAINEQVFSLSSISVVGGGNYSGGLVAWNNETARWKVEVQVVDANGNAKTDFVILTNQNKDATHLAADYVNDGAGDARYYPAYTFAIADGTELQFTSTDKLNVRFYSLVSDNDSSIRISQLYNTEIVGNSFTAADHATNGSKGVFRVTSKVVPEPATATLSLLALAGIAARRRRK